MQTHPECLLDCAESVNIAAKHVHACRLCVWHGPALIREAAAAKAAQTRLPSRLVAVPRPTANPAASAAAEMHPTAEVNASDIITVEGRAAVNESFWPTSNGPSDVLTADSEEDWLKALASKMTVKEIERHLSANGLEIIGRRCTIKRTEKLRALTVYASLVCSNPDKEPLEVARAVEAYYVGEVGAVGGA